MVLICVSLITNAVDYTCVGSLAMFRSSFIKCPNFLPFGEVIY